MNYLPSIMLLVFAYAQGCSTFDCMDCQYLSRFTVDGPHTSGCFDVKELEFKSELQEQRLILFWEYSGENIVLLIEAPLVFQVALAFDVIEAQNFSIYDKDVINIQLVGTGQTVRVWDSHGGVLTTLSDAFLQGQQSWEVLGFAIENESKLRVKIRRARTTSEPRDFQFTDRDVNVAYFLSNEQHQTFLNNYDRGVVLVPFSVSLGASDRWRDFVQKGHVIFNFVFWGLLADVGVFFSRYMRSYPKYAKVHGMIFLYIAIATYLFGFAMIQYNKTKIQEIYFYSTKIILHFIMGVCLITILALQMLLGMVVKNNLESLNGSDKIYRVKLIHRIVGYLIYLVAKAQVAVGMHIYAPELLILFYGYYILLFFFKVFTEVLYYFQVSLLQRERITYYYVEVDKNQIYETLLEKINLNTPRNQLIKEYPKLNYVILREGVYDVSDFNHPGGQYILDKITGMEIGRYFYGGFPIQNLRIKMHVHTQYAINYIETRYIGDFKNECCPILYHEEQSQAVSDKFIWKFEDYRPLARDAGLFTFQSHYFQVRQSLKGVQWFGRYFYIKPYGTGLQLIERPYSVVLCLSDVNIRRRAQIIDYFKSQILEENYEVEKPEEGSELSIEVGFIIKRHAFSLNMSRFLHGQAHKPYEITGPYGLGLELNSNSDGIHMVFCQGTGILPFLDLIDYLLKRTLYNILYDQRGKDIASAIVYNEEDYRSTFGDDFSLIVHGAFEDEAHFYGLPIVQDLTFVCKTFNVPIFEMHARFSKRSEGEQDMQFDVVESKFNLPYMKRCIKYKPAKIYVCGSPQFEEDVIESLRDLGIPKKQIVIV